MGFQNIVTGQWWPSVFPGIALFSVGRFPRDYRNGSDPYHTLADWARPRNMYGKGGEVEANGRYHAPSCGCAKHSAS